MNLGLYFQIIIPSLSLISLFANIWVSYVHLSFKELQKHPSTILFYISLFEISMSTHSIALAVGTNFTIKGYGPHHIIEIITLFTTSTSTARQISCMINQMLFTGAVAGVLCYNTAMSVDLIITLRNPLISGKARMKYYHFFTAVIVCLFMVFNAIEASKYKECQMDAFIYLYMVWNFGLLTLVYLLLLVSAVICIIYIFLKNKKEINEYTKNYFKRHVTYSVLITSVWTVCIFFYWLQDSDPKFFDSKDNEDYFILTNLVVVSSSGAVQALLRNWEPAFWNCSKSLCRKRRKTYLYQSSLISSHSSSTLQDSKLYGDMWNMPMSFIIQENMKSNTTLCILSGVIEAIKVSDPFQSSEFPTNLETRPKKSHKIWFSQLKKKYPALKFFNHPYFIVEEYCPQVFQRLRLLEHSIEYYLKSLNPSNNEKNLFSPNTEEGGSGSLIIFTDDNQLVLKVIQESERKSLISGFLVDYLNHIELNCSSLLNRIFGVFTVKIPGLAPLEIILSEGLNNGELIKFYDLKGSTVHRGGETTKQENFKGPLKDNDFISEKEELHMDIESVAHLTFSLMNDFKFLLQHEIMDYSVMISIFKDNTYKGIHDTVQNRWYRFGIIDFLDKYSFKRKAEYYLKKLRYGKKIKLCSVMKPIDYYERMIRFLFKKVILMR